MSKNLEMTSQPSALVTTNQSVTFQPGAEVAMSQVSAKAAAVMPPTYLGTKQVCSLCYSVSF